MKRLNNLYEKIYTYPNIELAHHNARKGKQRYAQVKKVDEFPGKHFLLVREMLKNKTFRNSEYKVFKRIEGGKEREIYKLPYFPDRIIHHCILQIILPIWTKSLIADTYACVKGRGIHKGVNRIKIALQDQGNTEYCLKGDIKKFYPSVNHEILKGKVRRKIKDKNLLWLLDSIIDSTVGIPIGNYLSQHFGNLYLSDFDHWLKEEQGCRYYFRYCDDFVILHSSKDFLHNLCRKMEEYLQKSLRLTLKDNWQVFPVAARGIDFLGYRFFHDYTLLRKSIVKRIKRKSLYIKKHWQDMPTPQIVSGIMSYYGWMKHGNCMNLAKSSIDADIVEIMHLTCEKAGIGNPLPKLPHFVA